MTGVNGQTDLRLSAYRDAVDRKLASLKPYSCARTLASAIEHALFPGGKRLRPLLALACGEALGPRTDDLVAVAASVELLHTASLILDDLPAMDNAEARRGRKSLHLQFTPHLAILCGHALVSQALYLPTQTQVADAACRKIVAELSSCIGPHGMAAGQAEDLEGIREPNAPDGLRVAARKTGGLFRAAACCGALASGADDRTAALLGECGMHLGIAYQIADDLRDAEVEDPARRSVNVAALLGTGKARQSLQEELAKAQASAQAVTQDGVLFDLIEIVGSHG